MITVVGLGPGGLDRVPAAVRLLLTDERRAVIVRTRSHPAAEELARIRSIVDCDDLYEGAVSFDDLYQAISQRVFDAARSGPVIYAVPGSPYVGEFAVRKILAAGGDVDVVRGESFVDAILAEVGYDPLDRGLQIVDGHDLPDPLVLDKPTIVAHLDRAEILAEALSAVARVVAEGSAVTLLAELGSQGATILTAPPEEIDVGLAGLRTSLFVDAEPGGLIGAVQMMRRLREECPWDRTQTHHTLVENLVEEVYELIEAIAGLDEDAEDWVAYARVEDELGDVLLQVLFHEAIARQNGGFDIDAVAEVLRQKLVRRHPHVFGDVQAETPEAVKANWDRIKAGESAGGGSALDGVPTGLPGLHRAAEVQNRAAKVGFDWDHADQVLPKLAEELEELSAAMGGEGDIEGELGDLLFSTVNLARHLDLDPEIAIRRAVASFEGRFRRMEAGGPLEGLSLDELDRRWARAKEEG